MVAAQKKEKEMLEQLKQRRSCRFYDNSRAVETEKLNEVINAGLYAANGMGYQHGIIIAITNKEVRNKLASLNGKIAGMPEGVDPFYGAPVVLLVAVKKWPNAKLDGAAMLENMLIEATNQGLGSCWIHRGKEELESEEGKEILSSLNLNLDEYEGVGHVILGYPAKKDLPEKKINDNRVFCIN